MRLSVRGIGLTDKQKIVSAAAWSIGAGLLGRAVGLIGTLLIARHLSPGVVAEVTVATVIALTGSWISAWGCGQYVIVRAGEGREAVFGATVFYLVFGMAVVAGLWWMTPTLAAWFSTPRLVEYLPGALIGIAIRRLGAIPDKLLARELRFTRIALASALGDITYALVAVTLVSTTRLGGQAMILGFVAQSCVIAAITIAGTGWRSWLTPVAVSAARFRDIFRFGAPITGEITLSEGARYWDKPLMLRLLGADNAGAYGMAFNLAQVPAIYVGGHIGTVMMPAIVRAQPAERASLIVRALGLTAVVLFPMAFGLSVCASTLVAALLPPDWSQVAPLLSVLAAVSVLAPASFMLASFLSALGENGTLLRIELTTVLTLVGALALLSRWGVLAASFAVGIALAVQLALSLTACRRHGLYLHGLAAPLLRVMAACAVMVAGVLLLRAAIEASLDWEALQLVSEIAVGATSYFIALIFFGNDLLKDVLRLLSRSGKAELQRAATLLPSPGVPND